MPPELDGLPRGCYSAQEVKIRIMALEKFLFYIRPSNWFRLFKESKELSNAINTLLDQPDTIIKIESEYVANVGGMYVWVENYPYAYGRVTDRFYEWLGMLAVLDPESKEWKNVYNHMLFHEELRRKFEGKMPDRETVFRLHKAVEKAKREQQTQHGCCWGLG